MAKAANASNMAARAEVAKVSDKNAANAKGQKATAKPEQPVKHRPETLAKHMADRANELVGVHTDTPFPGWDECTEAQKAWWTDLAETAQKV